MIRFFTESVPQNAAAINCYAFVTCMHLSVATPDATEHLYALNAPLEEGTKPYSAGRSVRVSLVSKAILLFALHVCSEKEKEEA